MLGGFLKLHCDAGCTPKRCGWNCVNIKVNNFKANSDKPAFGRCLSVPRYFNYVFLSSVNKDLQKLREFLGVAAIELVPYIDYNNPVCGFVDLTTVKVDGEDFRVVQSNSPFYVVRLDGAEWFTSTFYTPNDFDTFFVKG
jgi:hypothetical protein